MLRSDHTNATTFAIYHNLSIMEGFKKQLGLFNKTFNSLPFMLNVLQRFKAPLVVVQHNPDHTGISNA